MGYYHVYIMANYGRTVLYTGVTGFLLQRVFDHKNGTGCRFTTKYHCCFLMYLERHDYVLNAIAREKLIKRWRREWKIRLIQELNPDLIDLADAWDFSSVQRTANT